MKKSLAHLPRHKKAEIKNVVSTILEMVTDCEMIILFGSHARGDWVDDTYREGGVVYEYKSDFDLLVVPKNKKTVKNDNLWYQLEQRLGRIPDRTPVSIIKHHIADLNQKIEDRFYFFTDIKKEGILLFNSGNFKLSRARRFSTEELKRQAEDYFKTGFQKAEEFYYQFEAAFNRGSYNISAFELHQAAEHACHTVLLVYTGYKPKVHNLDTLLKRTSAMNPELRKVFPQKTEEEKRLFQLLKKAYVDARYNDQYCITKEELEYISARVKKLHATVKKICKERIEGFG